MRSDSIRNQSKFSRETNSFLVALCGSLIASVQGYNTALSAILLSDDTFLTKFNPNNTSPLFSIKFILILHVGIIIGAMMSSTLADRLGRKAVLVYSSLLGVILVIWSATAEAPTDILVSRSLAGWIVGIGLSVGPIYSSEMSAYHERGQIVGFTSFATISGSILAGLCYITTHYWRVCVVFPSLILGANAALLIFALPKESPRWLLARKTPGECLQCLQILRRSNDVSLEFNVIYQVLSSDATQGDSWSDLFMTQSYLYRIIVCIILQIGMESTGILLVTTLPNILISLVSISNVELAVSLAVLSALLGSLFGLFYIDLWGRRSLLIIGSVSIAGTWVAMFACGYYGSSASPQLHYSSIIRLIFGSLLCLFTFIYSFSFGMVGYIIPSEIFPMRLRAKASSVNIIAQAITSIFCVLYLKVYITGKESLLGCFIFFAMISAAVGLLVLIGLPETKGLMLENMEDLFNIDQQESFCGCCPCCYYESNLPSSNSASSNSMSGGPNNYGAIYKHSTTPVSVSQRGSLTGRNGSYRFMGTKTVPQEQLLQNILIRNFHGMKGSRGGSQPMSLSSSANANALLEPTTLHKYSHDMRELKFEFFSDESEPLVRNPASSPPSKSSGWGSRTGMNILGLQLDGTTSGTGENVQSSSIYSYISPSNNPKASKKSFGAFLIPETISNTGKSSKSNIG